jgi:hypothetical protein
VVAGAGWKPDGGGVACRRWKAGGSGAWEKKDAKWDATCVGAGAAGAGATGGGAVPRGIWKASGVGLKTGANWEADDALPAGARAGGGDGAAGEASLRMAGGGGIVCGDGNMKLSGAGARTGLVKWEARAGVKWVADDEGGGDTEAFLFLHEEAAP